MTFNLNPGEYRIYTDVKMAKPVITEAPVSVEEIEISAFDLKVYPNPSQAEVHIQFPSLNIEPYELLLLNKAGEVVVQKRGLSTLGKNELQLDVNDLPAGAYHFLIKLGPTYANKEFVKID